jgi:hypothetical protein
VLEGDDWSWASNRVGAAPNDATMQQIATDLCRALNCENISHLDRANFLLRHFEFALVKSREPNHHDFNTSDAESPNAVSCNRKGSAVLMKPHQQELHNVQRFP